MLRLNLVIRFRNACLQVDLDLEQQLIGEIGPGFCFRADCVCGGSFGLTRHEAVRAEL